MLEQRPGHAAAPQDAVVLALVCSCQLVGLSLWGVYWAGGAHDTELWALGVLAVSGGSCLLIGAYLQSSPPLPLASGQLASGLAYASAAAVLVSAQWVYLGFEILAIHHYFSKISCFGGGFWLLILLSLAAAIFHGWFRFLRFVASRRWMTAAWFPWSVRLVCVVVGVVLTLSVMARVQRPNLTFARYLDSLQEIGRLPSVPALHAPDAQSTPTWKITREEGRGTFAQATLGGWLVTSDGCAMMLARSPSPAPPLPSLTSDGLLFSLDPGRGWLFVGAQGGHVLSPFCDGRRVDTPARRRYTMAFRVSDQEPIAIQPHDLRGLAGPPLSWIGVAAVGFLAALVVLHGRRIPGVRAGKCDEGHLTLDGESYPVPAGMLLPDGPVLVVGPEAPRPGTYRAARLPDGMRVVPGTLEALREAEKDEQASAAALALAILSMTAGPLLATALRGLLWPL